MYQSSAVTPSGTRSSTPAASTAPAVVTRSTPSAPRPRRRSHNADTTAGVSVSLASRSGSNTKSFWVPWPLANITRSGYVPPGAQRRGHNLRIISRPAGIQPLDPVVTAKPRPLAPHVAAGADEGRFRCSVAVTAGVEVSQNLRVAQRPRCGDAVTQPTVKQRNHFVDQSVGEHRLGTPGQSIIEKLCATI